MTKRRVSNTPIQDHRHRNTISFTPRQQWIDILRGLTVLSMVAYHFTWDLVHLAKYPVPWFYELPGTLWQQSICWSFILISGYSISLSLSRKAGHHSDTTTKTQSAASFGAQSTSAHSTLLRGFRLMGFGVAITIASFFLFPLQPIYFGVLTLLGSSVVLTALFTPILNRVNPKLGWVLFFILFAVTYGIGDGFVGFFGVPLAKLPDVLYRDFTSAYFGFPFPGFRSTDYFPLFPWLFLFLTGFYLQRAFATMQKANPTRPSVGILAIPAWVGRRALWIYLLHQPIILAGFLALGKVK